MKIVNNDMADKEVNIKGLKLIISTYTNLYIPYEIDNIIVKYLLKVPIEDIQGLNKINIYHDSPDYFPKNICGGHYPKELKGQAEIDIYLSHALPLLADEALAQSWNKLFFFLFGELFIASTLFHEIAHHKYTEVNPRLYKDTEESEKDAINYESELRRKVFPFRMRHYNIFNALYKYLYKNRINESQKASSTSHTSNPEYYKAKGNTHLHLKEYEKAVAVFTDLINLDSNYPGAYSDRGFAYGESGNRESAIEDFTQAIKINPKDYSAYFNRGVSFQTKKEWNRAINDYTKAIELGCPGVDVFHYRAFCYSEVEEFQKALDDLKTVINKHKNFPNSNINIE